MEIKKQHHSPKFIAVSGGVGGAKLALGLEKIVQSQDLMVIGNVGDDFRHFGLHISPDIDTLLYTLSGKSDVEKGWGLANDGQNIYKSDGSDKIWILDSKNFNEIDYIEVVTNNKKIKNINELEVVDNLIYANTYQFNNDVCVIINKDTGEVIGIINFIGLRDKVKQHPELDVLNGIAYNKKRKTFFVTGKKWNKIFEIKIFKS